MASVSSNWCPQCADCLQAALEASHAYHDLLGSLEAAHIREDRQDTYRLQVQVKQAVQRRDRTLAELCQHRGTHACAVGIITESDDLVDCKNGG
jgi:hypothetical protein